MLQLGRGRVLRLVEGQRVEHEVREGEAEGADGEPPDQGGGGGEGRHALGECLGLGGVEGSAWLH